MAEDDIVELLWHNGKIVGRCQTQISTPDQLSPPLHILRGSGSSGGEGNALFPLPQQNLFIQEDEMASWLHHQNFSSGPLYSSSIPVIHPQIPASPYDQPAARRVENFMNFSSLRGNIFTGGRVEAGSWIPVVTEPMQVGSSAISVTSGTGSSVTPSTVISGDSHTFPVPGLGRKDKAVEIETVSTIAGTSSSGTEPMETEIADERRRKNREYTIDVSSTPATHPQIPVALPPPLPISVPYDQAAARRVENFMNFATLRGNIFTGSRVETGPWISVVTEPMTAIPLSSATGSSVTPSTVNCGVFHTFPVPGLGRKDKAVAIETVSKIACTSFSGTEPVHIQPPMETQISSSPATHPQIPVSLAPPLPISAPYDQSAARRVENFMNFSRLRGNRWIPVVREPMQVGPSAIPVSSATDSDSSVTPSTVIGGVSHTFPVPGPCQKDKAVVIEPIHTQPATETESSDNRKRNSREYTIDEVEETREDRGSGSTARKRSRATEMHNLSEKKRREKINETMKNLQELVPHCNKTDKASMLEDVVDHVKWLRKQLKMICRGGGMMAPMFQAKMQRFMPHTAIGMMGMNQPPFIPFPRQDHMVGAGPSNPVPHHPFPNNQASDPSRVHILSQQPGVVRNQPQFPANMHPYSQSVGQQPPPLQNQTASQLSSSQASSSKEPDDQANQPTG